MFAEFILFQSATPACATGTCPNVASVVAVAPAVVSVPFVAQSSVKTTVQYRRGLLGRLQPVSGTVTYEPVEVVAKSAKASKGSSCKNCNK